MSSCHQWTIVPPLREHTQSINTNQVTNNNNNMEQSTPRNNDSNEIIENAVTPHTQSPLPHMQFFRSAAEASLRKKVAELMNINEAIRNKFAKIGITLDVVDYMNIESLKEKIILLQTENILSKEVRALLNNSLKQLQLEMEQAQKILVEPEP